jgi:hypothetical protein
MATKDRAPNRFLRHPGRGVDVAASHRFGIAALGSI